MKIPVFSPFSGMVIPIEEVPDPVFSAKMLGDGLAVKPEMGVAVAPVKGRITVLHSAGHAFAVQSDEAPLAVLVHIGLDTVKMKGEGFQIQAKVGDEVEPGQPIVRFDLQAIARAGHSVISPVILPDLPNDVHIEKSSSIRIALGSDVLMTAIFPE